MNGVEVNPLANAAAPPASKLGVVLACASMTMMFGAITSAAIFRAGDSDWTHIPMPPVLWVNTLILIASTVAIEKLGRTWAVITGLAFLFGQGFAWMGLRNSGISTAFFYVFTVAHAVHVAGGLFAMIFVRIESARIYWHFLTGLWLFLMVLFWIWR